MRSGSACISSATSRTTRTPRRIGAFAVSYGARGAEILLDAIARSNGTRASVVRELRRTQIRNGIIGNVAFDVKGDLVDHPMTILRSTHGRFVVDHVVHARLPARFP